MPLHYDLHPSLDQNMLFACTPPATINAADLPALPENWLAALNTLCYGTENLPAVNDFARHVNLPLGQTHDLSTSVALIYYRLTGVLDELLGKLTEDARLALIAAVTEDITLCTDGFINRIRRATCSFQQPASLGELIYQVRKSIVEQVAVPVTRGKEQAVHIHNQVSIIAAEAGLGIEANFQDDRTRDNTIDKGIQATLKIWFERWYTPFLIPFLLRDELRSLLTAVGYTRSQQEEGGYSSGLVEAMVVVISRFLPRLGLSADSATWKNGFVITYSQVDQDTPCICDVDWLSIQQAFFETLVTEGYLTTARPPVRSLMDCAHYDSLYPSDPTRLLEEYTNSILESYSGGGEKYIEIQSRWPQYWEKLAAHPTFRTREVSMMITNTSYLLKEKGLSDRKDLGGGGGKGAIGIPIALLVCLMTPEVLVYANKETKDKIENLLKIKNSQGWNVWMVAQSCRSRLWIAFLDRILQHEDWPSQDLIQDLLLEKNQDGYTVLLLTVTHKKSILLGSLLAFIASNKIGHCLSTDVKEALLLSTNPQGQNILVLAATHANNSNALYNLWNTFKSLNQDGLELLDQNSMQKLFLQKNIDGENILMQAARHSDGALEDLFVCLLDAVDNNYLDKDIIREMLLEKDNKGLNTLMRLTQDSEYDRIAGYLDFIVTVRERDYLDLNEAYKLFLRVPHQWESLVQRAHESPAVQKSLLNCVSSCQASLVRTDRSEQVAIFVLKQSAACNLHKTDDATHNALLVSLNSITTNPKNSACLLKNFSPDYFEHSGNLAEVTSQLVTSYAQQLSHILEKQTTSRNQCEATLFQPWTNAIERNRAKLEATQAWAMILSKQQLATERTAALSQLKKDHPCLLGRTSGLPVLFDAYQHHISTQALLEIVAVDTDTCQATSAPSPGAAAG